MSKFMQFTITQVRPGTFAINPTSPEFRPEERGGEVFIVRVTEIPDAISSGEVAKRLSNVVDPFDPPSIVTWAELEQEGE